MEFFIIILAVFAAIIAIYAFLKAKTLTVRRINIPDSPYSLSGKTIAVFSDIHLGFWISTKQLKKCVDRINSLHPDYVFFAGDFADKAQHNYTPILKETVTILSELKPFYGKFAVLGNNDYCMSTVKEFSVAALSLSGFTILRNAAARLSDDTVLIGVKESNYNIPDIKTPISITDESDYVILLSHQPDFIDTASMYDVDLQISAHSHGGQIYLGPFSKYFLPIGAKKYYRNGAKVGNTKLVISHGVGLHTLPFRLFSSPDILLIKFR